MTDHRKPRLELARVRVIGPPEAVARVVDAITTALASADPSGRYPSRHNPGHVRVYLEVSPE
ncbi:hypothetical protein KGD83_21850 [Nocardiopsis akebiae]|uniref:Monooxygenase n=1 Tax=Nocardiopsis akebiae TaxID=2831968 RepID=A0ABX8C378_9ACTN|nr:hypothetical protein [Nocardiopsis akebiae]QUX27899.1 hypothetical protein KGD83_21850 [Nocardiopsis akebiae]